MFLIFVIVGNVYCSNQKNNKERIHKRDHPQVISKNVVYNENDGVLKNKSSFGHENDLEESIKDDIRFENVGKHESSSGNPQLKSINFKNPVILNRTNSYKENDVKSNMVGRFEKESRCIPEQIMHINRNNVMNTDRKSDLYYSLKSVKEKEKDVYCVKKTVKLLLSHLRLHLARKTKNMKKSS